MRVVVVLALAAGFVACGGEEGSANAGGSGGTVEQPEGGSGGTLAQGGSGGGGAVDPTLRFDGSCIDPQVPRSTSKLDPLPVQYRFVPQNGMGVSCTGFVVEPRPGGADLHVFARTSGGTEWTAELGTDPRTTTPLICTAGAAGQVCAASFPADGQVRSVLVRLSRDGECLGAVRQDITVTFEGSRGGLQALDPTLCPR